jgi:hypothetical protein
MKSDSLRHLFKLKIPLLIAAVLCAANFSFAQTNTGPVFPKKIRGYKVYKAKILIQVAKDKLPEDPKGDFDSLVKVGMPQNFQLSLTGAAFEIPISMNIYKTGGRVESISFEDVRINGIKMNVDEFNQPFDFEKNVATDLPYPLKIIVDLSQGPGALLNFKPSLGEFEVTGKVYVFGTFKKMGMKFKRVIPADFKLKTKLDASFLKL